jgi:type II secretory pathway component GspD/PulD (secretin)
MMLASGVLGMALALTLSGSSARAQTEPALAKPSTDSVQTFYLINVNEKNEANEVVTALRNLLDPHDKVFLVPSENAIFVAAPPEQLVLAQKLLKDLDRPRKTYRLTYSIVETDDGKRIGTQHFSIIVVSGGRTTLKNGSKIPIVTGTYDAGTPTQNTQVTFLDIGLNVDASLDESTTGIRLRTKIERSSVAEEKSGVGSQDPIVRQTVLEGTSILTQGKPVTLGSLDIPGSARHLDVEVVLEVVP